MSFALEYRKQLLARERERQAQTARDARSARDPDPFAVSVTDAVETPGNRRKVFGALIVAALILTTFNSGALVYYVRGLADRPLGPELIELSESWHDMMAAGRLTGLVESVRAVVGGAREISWQELRDRLGASSFAATSGTGHRADRESGALGPTPARYGEPATPRPRQMTADGSG